MKTSIIMFGAALMLGAASAGAVAQTAAPTYKGDPDVYKVIFEDAHWSDATSLEALDRAVDLVATIRTLLIITFRPEFDPPWIGRALSARPIHLGTR